MSPAAPHLSLVFPVYNETRRLPASLREVTAWAQAQPWPVEIVVADDGSTDGTPEQVRAEFPHCIVLDGEPNKGKGAAVARGMQAARGRFRLFSDADLSTPIAEANGMLEAMARGGYDIVIASRALPESRLDVRQPPWREAAGRAFNMIVRPLSGLPFRDTQCGFKLFTAQAVETIFPHQQSSGWAFDVELLMLARAFGLRVLEHPVRWINNDASKVSLLSDAPRMLRDIIQFRLRILRDRPQAAQPAPRQETR
ncbi:MAG: Undecaprenyl-phosphate 4-deoxy-4-formamido-L-arabinose transferase [candidate division BRC1 bacterium ADurb.BinA292]|nr:MAG: Undecaprenyl-phosphate 4-deoxy-4-formamido-L-arabinose transferase [candidate division BRC1 bacterium ADurb.BinA292]